MSVIETEKQGFPRFDGTMDGEFREPSTTLYHRGVQQTCSRMTGLIRFDAVGTNENSAAVLCDDHTCPVHGAKKVSTQVAKWMGGFVNLKATYGLPDSHEVLLVTLTQPWKKASETWEEYANRRGIDCASIRKDIDGILNGDKNSARRDTQITAYLQAIDQYSVAYAQHYLGGISPNSLMTASKRLMYHRALKTTTGFWAQLPQYQDWDRPYSGVAVVEYTQQGAPHWHCLVLAPWHRYKEGRFHRPGYIMQQRSEFSRFLFAHWKEWFPGITKRAGVDVGTQMSDQNPSQTNMLSYAAKYLAKDVSDRFPGLTAKTRYRQFGDFKVHAETGKAEKFLLAGEVVPHYPDRVYSVATNELAETHVLKDWAHVLPQYLRRQKAARRKGELWDESQQGWKWSEKVEKTTEREPLDGYTQKIAEWLARTNKKTGVPHRETAMKYAMQRAQRLVKGGIRLSRGDVRLAKGEYGVDPKFKDPMVLPGFVDNWFAKYGDEVTVSRTTVVDRKVLTPADMLTSDYRQGEWPTSHAVAPQASMDILGEMERPVLGHTHWRPGQQEAIEAIAARKDVIVQMPTGAGKSFVYQGFQALHGGTVLVFSPLVALQKEQVERLREHGVAAYRYVDVALREKGKVDVVFVAPESLGDKGARRLAADLKQRDVTAVFVDESHCVSEWGESFRPHYKLVPGFIDEYFPGVPRVALSATQPEDIAEQLHMVDPHKVAVPLDRANIFYRVRADSWFDYDMIAWILHRPDDPLLIYVRRRAGVAPVAELAAMAGANIAVYTGTMPDKEREYQRRRWETGEANVMIATSAFGLGMDKSDVRGIFHRGLPLSVSEYYQESGRAGRDGKPSEATLYRPPEDTVTAALIDQTYVRKEKTEGEAVARQWRDDAEFYRNEIRSYADEGECRRAVLLREFGETAPCDACDVCVTLV